MRAAEELRSAAIFRAAAGGARRLGENQLALQLGAIVRDEIRHVRLCASVGAELGAPEPRYDLSLVRARLRGLRSPELRLTSILLVEGAIGETISTALFRAGRRTAIEPRTRNALTAILRDEVRHAQLGWRLMRSLWPKLSTTIRDSLQQEATRSLGSLEQTIALPSLKRLQAREPFAPGLAELGVLAPEERVEAFYNSVERLVIPRLTRLGLNGIAAWQNRYQGQLCGSPT
jgi:hypothetical protein